MPEQPLVLPLPSPKRAAEVANVLALLNAVAMTIDQFERGRCAYIGGASDPFDSAFYDKRAAALHAFCHAEGLLPADVAARAILVRWDEVGEAWDCGVDLKKSNPAVYESMVTGPITASQLGVDEWEDEDELAAG